MQRNSLRHRGIGENLVYGIPGQTGWEKYARASRMVKKAIEDEESDRKGKNKNKKTDRSSSSGREENLPSAAARAFAAETVADEERLRGLVHNLLNNPINYLVNPMVGGPITHLYTLLTKRQHGLASAGPPIIRNLARLGTFGGNPVRVLNPLFWLQAPFAVALGGKAVEKAKDIHEKYNLKGQDTFGSISQELNSLLPEEARKAKGRDKDLATLAFGLGIDKDKLKGDTSLRAIEVEGIANALARAHQRAGYRNVLEHNPFQYFLNPVVPGPKAHIFASIAEPINWRYALRNRSIIPGKSLEAFLAPTRFAAGAVVPPLLYPTLPLSPIDVVDGLILAQGAANLIPTESDGRKEKARQKALLTAYEKAIEESE